jgi:uncharacterized membrane protein
MELIPIQILIWMAIVAFSTGVLTLIGGIVILVVRVSTQGVGTLANQVEQITQKSITEDLAELVANASTLFDSVSQMIKTAAGIGVFLCCLGLTLMVSSSILIYFLNRVIA